MICARGPSIARLHQNRVTRNPVFGVTDQVRHKPGCTATEDGQRLEFSDLGSRGIAQLICAFAYRICIKQVLS